MNDPFKILLVEDNEADAEIVRRFFANADLFFANADLPVQLTVVDHGEDAIDILRCNARFSEVLRPDMILVDVSLPKTGGLKVLEELSSDELLVDIPVVVLAGSAAAAKKIRAANLRATRVIAKPKTEDKFAKALSTITQLLVHAPV